METKDKAFESYKKDFEELTSKKWNDHLTDYMLFLQWKVQEQQLVALNQLCTEIKPFRK